MRYIDEERDEYEMELGRAIRQMRIRKDLTLEDVAARANLSPTSVRALELGRGSTVATLVRVLRVMGETRLITDWAGYGQEFSPVAMLRKRSARPYDATPKRVSRRGRKHGSGGGEGDGGS